MSGAGSINNSPTIEVTSPDLFDVSAVTGGYVLGAAQTLKGLGTVNGSVRANGRITPGSTAIGTLSFASDLILNSGSTVLMRLNNTNSPNSDNITCYTFTPGGTLIITNTGGALNPGDTFTLFTPAVVGSFSSIVYPPGLRIHQQAGSGRHHRSVGGCLHTDADQHHVQCLRRELDPQLARGSGLAASGPDKLAHGRSLGDCARCGAAVHHARKSGQWLGVLSVGVSMIGSVGLRR